MDPHQDEKTQEGKGAVIDIFTVLGHDLKSPLNAVESYLELIRDKVLGDEVDAYMTILGNSIARLHLMRELVTDVVDWSRVQGTASPRILVELDISRIVRSMLDRYTKEAKARGIAMSAKIEDGLTMKAVPREIELILGHLLDNAIKYNRDNGNIRATMKKAGNGIALTVSDTGIGLSRDEQGLLFQAFMRIRNSRTQDIRGTGLGLAIVKQLIDLYKGTIQVESEPDKGTTFLIVLSCCD
jgi:signal transduction histidine kinase